MLIQSNTWISKIGTAVKHDLLCWITELTIIIIGPSSLDRQRNRQDRERHLSAMSFGGKLWATYSHKIES